MAGEQCDRPLIDQWVQVKERSMTGLQNLEIFQTRIGFSEVDHGVLVDLGTAGEVNAPFEFLLIEELHRFL
ncbi:hypothetical protein M1N89_02670 [Dehalococcoidia bacterium]|nr:hypothetical protein [Dehalococcoidia bacterium]